MKNYTKKKFIKLKIKEFYAKKKKKKAHHQIVNYIHRMKEPDDQFGDGL